VGLAKLIGTWRNENHKMQFYNYNSAKFSVKHYEEAIEMDPLAMILFPQFQAAKFNYNLVPTDSDEWIMFISGEEKSFLSSLKFQNNKAFFKLIDSETGKVKFSTILYKE